MICVTGVGRELGDGRYFTQINIVRFWGEREVFDLEEWDERDGKWGNETRNPD